VRRPDDFPRVPLALLPTSLERLERLGDVLSLKLWMRRDDYTGLGGGWQQSAQTRVRDA